MYIWRDLTWHLRKADIPVMAVVIAGCSVSQSESVKAREKESAGSLVSLVSLETEMFRNYQATSQKSDTKQAI